MYEWHQLASAKDWLMWGFWTTLGLCALLYLLISLWERRKSTTNGN